MDTVYDLLLFNQHVRINMAVLALREILVDRFAVRKAMTVLALRHRRMGTFVTVYARQLSMFCCGLAQAISNVTVAGSTEGNRGPFRRHNVARLMGVMAGQAICGLLSFLVRLMAFRTVRNSTVHIVTEGAGALCMLALIFIDPFDFLFMTGAALGFGILRQFKRCNRHMRIGVKAKTVIQLEMRRAFMTAGTLGNAICTVWKMFHMTVKTGDFRLVLSAIAGYFLGLLGVTFNAVCHL